MLERNEEYHYCNLIKKAIINKLLIENDAEYNEFKEEIISLKKHVIPFVKEIFTVSPYHDTMWFIKKGIHMTMGKKVLKKIGLDPNLPHQGFYNHLKGLVNFARFIEPDFGEKALEEFRAIKWPSLIMELHA